MLRVVLGLEKGEGALAGSPAASPAFLSLLPPPSISPTQHDSNLTFIPWSFRSFPPPHYPQAQVWLSSCSEWVSCVVGIDLRVSETRKALAKF